MIDIVLVDAADIADQVRCHIGKRILAEQARLDLHAGKTEQLRRHACDFVVVQLAAYRHGLQRLPFSQQFLETLDVLGRNVDQPGQLGYQRIHVRHLVRRDLQRVAGIILRHDHAVAVHDQAAIRHDGNDVNAVIFAQRMEVVVADDLQVEETQQQNEQHHRHKTQTQHQSQTEIVDFALMVLQLDVTIHSSFGSRCGRRRACSNRVMGVHSSADTTAPRKYSHAI